MSCGSSHIDDVEGTAGSFPSELKNAVEAPTHAIDESSSASGLTTTHPPSPGESTHLLAVTLDSLLTVQTLIGMVAVAVLYLSHLGVMKSRRYSTSTADEKVCQCIRLIDMATQKHCTNLLSLWVEKSGCDTMPSTSLEGCLQ